MRKIIFFFIGVLFVACSTDESNSNMDNKIDLLIGDKWVVSVFEGKKNKLGEGVVFSKDKQLFNIDSQGRIIPTHHKQIFDLNNDTLRIIDYKYEEQFLDEKATLVFEIKELSNKLLRLHSIYPDTKSTYKLLKEEL